MATLMEPMLPTLVKVPFSNPDWIFEPKWDGYRAICFLQNGSVRFESKNRKSLTQRFPDLGSINKSIKAETAIIDGEIVALDKKGLPCFAGLRSGKAASECAIVFYAFDLLHLNGDDLTQKPVIERKAVLKRILPKQRMLPPNVERPDDQIRPFGFWVSSIWFQIQ
jgi:bifunctional non-homologous end joining protein LigD